MRDYLVAAAIGCGLLTTLRRPWTGVLVYLWLAYLNPHRLCYGFAYNFPFTLVAVIVLIFSLLFSGEVKRLPLPRETIILILFAFWITLTTFTSLNSYAAWDKWKEVMKIFFMVLLITAMMRSRNRLNGAVWVIVLSIGYYGVRGALGTIATGGAHRIYGPADTFIADNNDLAVALVTVIPLAAYALTLAHRRTAKLAVIGTIGCLAVAVVGTYSRAGLLGLLAVSLMLCWKSRRRLAATTLVVALLCLVYFVAPSAWFSRMQTIGNYQDDSSAMGRINAWHFAINLAADHPLTGGGFEAFTPELFQQYAPEPDNYHAAHSIYFKILGEHGYVGLILFMSLWVSTWFTANRVRKEAKEVEGAAWAEHLAAMAQVAMIGYAVGGAFDNLCYFDLPYHLMAIILGCKAAIEEKSRLKGSNTHDNGSWCSLQDVEPTSAELPRGACA